MICPVCNNEIGTIVIEGITKPQPGHRVAAFDRPVRLNIYVHPGLCWKTAIEWTAEQVIEQSRK